MTWILPNSNVRELLDNIGEGQRFETRTFTAPEPKQFDPALLEWAAPREAYKRWNKSAGRKKKNKNEVMLSGPITSYAAAYRRWAEDESVATSLGTFRKDLDKVDGDIVVRINSPGGDVFEAAGVHQILDDRQNDGDIVTMCVDGLAASAAAMVMLGGDKIIASRMSSIMVHAVTSFSFGGARALRAAADHMESVDNVTAEMILERQGVEATDKAVAALVTKLQDKDIWYTARQAKAAGLVDDVRGGKKTKDDSEGTTARSRMRDVTSRLAAHIAHGTTEGVL